MKNSFFSLLMLLISGVTAAQSSKIELLDLVKLFSPDSAAVEGSTSWSNKPATSTRVKWKRTLPDKNFSKTGVAQVSVKGKTLKCQRADGGDGNCEWVVTLTGTKAKYTSFTIEADNLHFENQNIDMIDYFFGKNNLQAKLLGKDTESMLYWNYQYLLRIPGEKEIWMKIEYMNQTATASQAESNDYTDLFYMEFYTDKKTFDAGL